MSVAHHSGAAVAANACRLEFSAGAGGTSLEHASADAPWRALRAAPAACCDAVVVQTRGGMIDGDRWRLSAHASQGARVVLRATGATVVYSGTCFLRTTLRASSGAALTQRSSGLILRPGAAVRATTLVHAESGGSVVATEAVALADCTAAILRTVVARDNRILLDDRLGLDGDRLAPWGLAGATHVGSLVAVGLRRSVRLRTLARALPPSAGVCIPRPGCALARVRAHSLEEIRSVLAGLVAAVSG